MESMHTAIRNGDIQSVARLLDSDPAQLETPDERGWCAIHTACECGNSSIVRLLIERGADVNAQTDDGLYCTALDMAAGNGSAGVVELLLSAGARLDIRDDYEHTPIHTAAIYGRPKALEALICAGADVNDRVDGWTPLTYAEAHIEDRQSRPRFSEHVPSATEEEYEAVVTILRRYGGVI